MKRWKDGENRYASYHQNPSKEQVKTVFAGIDADILVKTHMKPLERAILIIKAKMRKFYYLVKMTFLTKFAYMKAFWFDIAGTAASIVIYYFLWQYVFRQQ